MNEEFGTSRIVATLGLSFFVLGISLGPMMLSPLSEFYGRRPIYIIAWSLYLIWTIPSAVAQNIETMLIARFFTGLSGSAFLAVSGGTVGDLFNRHELQAPMILWSLTPFCGPAIGPTIGGFINYFTSWRWTYYVLIIWDFVMLVAIVCLVPETYREFDSLCEAGKEKRKKERPADAPIQILSSFARRPGRSGKRQGTTDGKPPWRTLISPFQGPSPYPSVGRFSYFSTR